MKYKILIHLWFWTDALIYALVISSVMLGYTDAGFYCLHLAGGLCLLVMFSALIFILINVMKGDK